MIPVRVFGTPLPAALNVVGYSGHADLEQTKLFSIRMQTVSFGIHCDASGNLYLRKQLSELRRRYDHIV